MFVLSKLIEDSAIHNSILIYHKSCPLVFISKINRIEIYKVVRNKLIRSKSIFLQGKVQSFCKINLNGVDIILFINEQFEIGLIYLNSDSDVIVKTVTKLSTAGQQQGFDSNPTLVPSSYKNPKFIVLNVFHLNLQILYFNKSFDPNQWNSEKKRKYDDKVFDIISLPVGNISIKQVIVLSNPENVITMLYKDLITSTFHIRCLKLFNKKFELFTQFSAFEQDPSLIVPMNDNGFMVFTFDNLFYFPFTKKTLSASKDLIVSEKEEACVLKKISSPYSLKSVIKTCAMIDDSRVLVCDESGSCFMLYMDLDFSIRDVFVVNQINLIKLGSTTIPEFNQGLHHVGNGLFFQASNVSKSLLFQVLPDEPHITIHDELEASPPIIDMKLENHNLYTCQGGWEGSELRKFVNSKYQLEVSKMHRFTNLHKTASFKEKLYIEYWNKNYLEKKVYNLKLQEQVSEFNGHDWCYTSDAWSFEFKDGKLLINDELQQTDSELTLQKAFLDLQIVICTSYSSVYIFDQDQVQTIKITNEEITSVDLLQVAKEVYVLSMSDLAGNYKIFKLYQNQSELLYENNVNNLLTVKILPNVLVLLTNDGTLVQMLYELSSKFIIGSISYQFNRRLMKLIKQDESFIIFDDDVLFVFDKALDHDYHLPNEINLEHKLETVHFVDQQKVVLVFQSGLVEVAQLKLKTDTNFMTYSAIYSRNFYSILLPIENTSHLIAVEYDNSSGSVKSIINLVNKLTWHIVSSIEIDATEVVDLCTCPIDSNGQFEAMFVGLTNSQNPLLLFGVKETEIELIKKCNIANMKATPNMNFKSISLMERHNENEVDFCVSGNVLLILSFEALEEFTLSIRKGFGRIKTFVAAQSIGSSRVYLGDVLHGLCGINTNSILDGRKMEFDLELPLSNFLIDLNSLHFKDHVDYILTGDAFREVTLFKDTKDELIPEKDNIAKILTFNCEDQINKILSVNKRINNVVQLFLIGTKSGGVYLLSEIVNEEMLNAVEKDIDLLKAINSLSTLNLDEQNPIIEQSEVTKLIKDNRSTNTEGGEDSTFWQQVVIETSYIL